VVASRLSRLHSFVAFALACAAILSSESASAQGRPTLAGVWNASALAERWNVGDWGKACGPRPAPQDLPGGQVTVQQDAAELVMSGLGRTFRTNECWEQLPGVTRNSHSASNHSWRTRCTSAPNDPRQTAVVTTITATDNTILLDETGEYQFRIEGQNCTASTRRTRNFVLSQRQGEAPLPSAVQPGATLTAAPQPRSEPLGLPQTAPSARTDKCAVPGEPARLEVRPVRKWLAPGQRFTFRAVALDANGCSVDARITWALANPDAKVLLMPGGTVAVAEDAEDGTLALSVSFAGRSVPVFIEVASQARYEELLSAGSINDAGEGDEAAATIVASGSLGSNSAIAQDGAHSRKTTFVVIIGGLALGLAALGFVLLRRGVLGSPATANGDGGTPASGDAPSLDPAGYAPPGGPAGPAPGVIVSQGKPIPGRPAVCPSCRTEFPPGSVFCPHDGNRLVGGPLVPQQGSTAAAAGGICPTCGRGYDPGVKTCPVHGDDLVPAAVYRATASRTGVATERGKICPSCGGRYGGQATFCGKDGTALVLVN